MKIRLKAVQIWQGEKKVKLPIPRDKQEVTKEEMDELRKLLKNPTSVCFEYDEYR